MNSGNKKIKIMLLLLFSLLMVVSSSLAQHIIARDSFNQQYVSGLQLLGAQKYDQAIEQFKNIIEQDSAFVQAYIKLVLAYKENKQLDIATNYFKESLINAPQNPFAYYGTGLVEEQKEHFQRAIQYFQKAIQIYPHCAMFFYNLIGSYNRLKKLNEAVQYIKVILKRNPDNAVALYGLGHAFELQNQWEKALENLNKAIRLDKDLLLAYHSMGNIYRYTGKFKESSSICNTGLEIAERNNDPEYKSQFLQEISIIYRKFGSPEQALEYLEQALEIDKQYGNKRGEASKLESIGNTYSNMGDYPKALQFLDQAVKITQELGDKRELGIRFSNMGVVYRRMNNLPKALEYYQRAIKIARELGDKRRENIRLGNIGVVYKRLGDFTRALFYYEKALKLAREINDKSNEARHLGNIGVIYNNLGEYDKSLNYFKQAVNITRKIGFKRSQERHLGNIGLVYHEIGNYSQALIYFRQSLMIAREIGDKESQGISLGNIGLVFADSGDLVSALKYYKQALKIDREIGNKKSQEFVLNAIGDVNIKSGNYSDAVQNYQKALVIAQKIRSPKDMCAAYTRLAAAYGKLGQNKKALRYYRLAIAGIEKIRGKLATAEFKAGFLEKRMAVYDKIINLLVYLHEQYQSKGYDQKAFYYAEKARARAFLDLLTEAREGLDNKIDPALKQKEKQLLYALSRVQTKLQKPNLSDDEWKKLIARADSIQHENDVLKIEIRQKCPGYARVVYPEPYTVRQVQQHLSGKNTALVEFFLGDDCSFVWTMTDNSFYLHPLPTRTEIAPKVKEYLQTISRPVGLNNPFAAHFQLGYELYQILLEPAINRLKGMQLIIIPDDILYYLPFETLICNKADPEGPVHYLTEEYQISYAPSATSWCYLQEDSRKTKKKRSLLAFGDPFFGPGPMMATARGEKQDSSQVKDISSESLELFAEDAIQRGIYERCGYRFNRLPFSGTEVQEIARLFPPDQENVYMGEKAKEEVVKGTDLTQYRYIHFATHGIVDPKFPPRSAIVLTLDDDPAEDGFLQVHEICNLKLNADLVVLSACRTGLGELRRGEGIMGLARAFFYAGTPSVVVSLWNINDRATAVFMKNFYRFLKKGYAKSSALQQAKLDMLQSERKLYRHPFYWAPFVLIGACQ